MSATEPIRNGKTLLAPCMGVGKIVAAVTRRASYLIKGQCPEDVELLSIPALLAGDPDERKLLQETPSVIIDGCALRCTAQIFKLYGVDPVAKIEVNQIMKERKLGPGKTRKELEETGKKLSDFTAERVLSALRDEGLAADFVPLDDLSQPPPDAGCGCPDRIQIVPQASSLLENNGDTPNEQAGSLRYKDAAVAEAATDAGVCQTGPAGEITASGTYKVNAVTVLPCQGIKRTGGRVTQRAAYDVVEDRFLGKSHVLCISALAAGCQEDVDMLEKFPTVAVNGCGKRCASIAADHHGIPAVAHVELDEVDPDFDGEAYCLEAELTAVEMQESKKLADAISVEVEKLLGSEIDWRESKVNLHGLVHEPGKINAQTGFKDAGKGFLVKLAKAQLEKETSNSSTQSHGEHRGPQRTEIGKNEKAAAAEVASAQANCEYPGLKSVVHSIFKPKPKPAENKEST